MAPLSQFTVPRLASVCPPWSTAPLPDGTLMASVAPLAIVVVPLPVMSPPVQLSLPVMVNDPVAVPPAWALLAMLTLVKAVVLAFRNSTLAPLTLTLAPNVRAAPINTRYVPLARLYVQ